MPNFIAQIGTFDFADFVRVGPTDGLDPYGKGWAEPQFADSAFGAGQALTGVTVGNREMVWPLYLNVHTLYPGEDLTPELELLLDETLHELVIRMNRALAEPNLQVQWAVDHAENITFYDVAYARFDPDYDHRRDTFGWKGGTLRVWCNPPYGHTGTHRVVATSAGGSAAARIPVPSTLQGDVAAALDVSVRRGGAEALAAPGRTVAIAAVPSGVEGLIPGASMVAGPGASVAGGVLTHAQTFVGDPGARGQVHLSPGSAYAGRRMRVLAVAQTNSRSGLRVAASKDDRSLGAAQLATAVSGRQILDLGAMEVSAIDSRATHTIDLLMTVPVGSGLYGEARVGTAGVHALIVAPEETLSIVNDRAAALVAFDDTMAASAGHVTDRYDSTGNQWQADPDTGFGATVAAPFLVGTQPNGRVDQHGFTATSPWTTTSRGAGNMLAHRPLADMTAQIAVSLDSVRTVVVGVEKVIYDGLVAGATTPVLCGAALGFTGNGFSDPTCYLNVYAEGATDSMLASVAAPFGALGDAYPNVVQLSQRGNTITARALNIGGSVVAEAVATHPGVDRPGRTFVAMVPASGAQTHRILDVEVLGVPSVVMSPTDTYRIASGGYRSHPSHGFSGEVAVLGAAPELPLDTAAVVVAIGGHEAGDAPSVNDVTIRAQERFTLAR